IVDPPDKTIFLYNGLRTSIGQFWMTSSTISPSGNISGPKNLSYPTSTLKDCCVILLTPVCCLNLVGSLSYLANSLAMSGHI
ncbi:GSCOCG00004062001-RA-CDS, partial [Cotesia congregata]